MSTLLRPGVLDGVHVLLSAPSDAVAATCAHLGAVITALDVDLRDDDVTAAALAGRTIDVLVADARGPFGAGGLDGLRAAVDGPFFAARACVNGPFATAGRGRVVLIAPAPGAGEHSGAVRAALENEARGLSTEWARLGVTVVAILPGDATSEDELSGLVAFLASPAGGYYAGCAMQLGAVAA